MVPLRHPSIGLRSKRVRSRSEMVKQVSFRSEGVNGNVRVKGCQEAGVKAFFSSLSSLLCATACGSHSREWVGVFS